MKRFAFLLLISGLILEYAILCIGARDIEGKIWALLAAGSYGWDNYRHQADIYHTYQILNSSGIPEEKIIVMMYGDIALNFDIPNSDVIINSPGGPNLNHDKVPNDFSGELVNAAFFLDILRGNISALRGTSRKVIQSGPNDVIFVNFVGYGGLGILCFLDDNLFVGDLIQTIEWMYDNNKYSKLIIYVEACQAGSLFDQVPLNTKNVFVLTAAGSHANSFALYWDEVKETYLSNVFSNVWMNYTENKNISEFYHLYDEFNTNISRAKEYGDLNIGVKELKHVLLSKKKLIEKSPNSSLNTDHPKDTADNMDIPLIILRKKLMAAKNPEKRRQLEAEIKQLLDARKIVNRLIIEILTTITENMFRQNIEIQKLEKGTEPLTRDKFRCYKRLITEFYKKCGSILKDPYHRVYFQIFVNICSIKCLREEKEYIPINAITKRCANYGSASHERDRKYYLCPKNETVPLGWISHTTDELKITCQNHVMDLTCGPSKIINIKDATWGRFDQTTCGSYPDFHQNCSAMDDTYHRVRERCHGKFHCSMKATIIEFSDPCVYFQKYLTVRFSCLSVDPSSITSVVVCETFDRTIRCPTGSSLLITDGFWGRKDMNLCSRPWREVTNCSAEYMPDMLSAKCDNRQECELTPRYTIHGDPCSRIPKYMKADYRCVKGIERKRMCDTEPQSITCPPNSKIHIVEAFYGRSHPYMCIPKDKIQYQPIMTRDCNIRNRTTDIRKWCHGKRKCTFKIKDLGPESCKNLYTDIKYFCQFDGSDGSRPDTNDVTDDGYKIPVSPGPPFIISLDNYPVAAIYFRVPKMKDPLYYKLQLKKVLHGHFWDWNLSQYGYPQQLDDEGLEIRDLAPSCLYDIRVVLKYCDRCNHLCVPYARFRTGEEIRENWEEIIAIPGATPLKGD